MGYAWDAQRGSKRRQEANLNVEVKPKQDLRNCCGKKRANARSMWKDAVDLCAIGHSLKLGKFLKYPVKVTKDQISDQHWSLNAFGYYLNLFLYACAVQF